MAVAANQFNISQLFIFSEPTNGVHLGGKFVLLVIGSKNLVFLWYQFDPKIGLNKTGGYENCLTR